MSESKTVLKDGTLAAITPRRDKELREVCNREAERCRQHAEMDELDPLLGLKGSPYSLWGIYHQEVGWWLLHFCLDWGDWGGGGFRGESCVDLRVSEWCADEKGTLAAVREMVRLANLGAKCERLAAARGRQPNAGDALEAVGGEEGMTWRDREPFL